MARTFISLSDNRGVVRIDAIDGLERKPHSEDGTRVHLRGGGIMDLAVNYEVFSTLLADAVAPVPYDPDRT